MATLSIFWQILKLATFITVAYVLWINIEPESLWGYIGTAGLWLLISKLLDMALSVLYFVIVKNFIKD